MARRGHRRDDERAGGAGVAVVERAKDRNLHDHVLGLQRDYGNTAVTAIVQRKGSMAASTDAPGYKAPKGKAAPKKKKGPTDEEKYLPTPDGPLSSMSVGDLNSAALDAWKHAEDPALAGKGGKNSRDAWFEKAARYFEQAWLKTPGKASRAIALNIARVYKAWGEAARADFWMKVQSGEIDPKAPKQEDMSDKSF